MSTYNVILRETTERLGRDTSKYSTLSKKEILKIFMTSVGKQKQDNQKMKRRINIKQNAYVNKYEGVFLPIAIITVRVSS